MANKTSKVVKKKKKKQKGQSENQKVEQAKKERQRKVEKLEQEKHQVVSTEKSVGRLAEAIILSEIIGLPRCKQRRTRGNSRRSIG